MSADSPSVVPQAARRLASRAAGAIASAVLRRAVRRVNRDLAALDDCTLADIGLDRAAVDGLTAISRRATWMPPAHFARHRPHIST